MYRNLLKVRRGIRSHETGITGSCERPCRFWELNPDDLQEQQVSLTIEPSLQTINMFSMKEILKGPGGDKVAVVFHFRWDYSASHGHSAHLLFLDRSVMGFVFKLK